MLCSPIFLLIYWYFCRTLYKFCMYGGVKKRGSILAACMIFFLSYLVWYLVSVRKIKIAGELPEKMNTVKWYGFSRELFYLFDKENGFYAKQCNDEEKDYLRLKYSELPKYKHFFWKVLAYVLLIAITIMTICGVVKSGTNLNGKLAWYLFDLRHTPIVAEQSEEITPMQEENAGALVDVTEETISVQYPDKELYGTINIAEKYYEDENGKTNYHYKVYQYIFSDLKYQKVNETLQDICDEKVLEYQAYYEQNGPFIYTESIPEYQKNYEEKTWYLVNLSYVGEDYVSLLYNDVQYWAGAAHPMSYFSPVTIDIHTGEIVDVEDVLGCTWSELSQRLYGASDNAQLNSDEYGFYLLGNEVHFIYRTSYFVDEIIVSREGMD